MSRSLEAIVVQSDRSVEVAQRIIQLKNAVMVNFLEMGRLLIEARDNDYHTAFGFVRFGDWVESEHGLDVGERQAYYLMQIVGRAAELGIGDDQLVKVNFSKLKEIFSLRSAEPEVIKELVAKAETTTLAEIREDVQAVKIADGAEAYTYITLKLPVLTKKNIVDKAHERVRRMYGNTVDADGELVDIPDWRCLELIYSDFLSEPEKQDSGAIDAEFEDYNDTFEEA